MQRIFIYWGSVAASVILAYIGFRKPRKDIVSLCTPVIALFAFVIPLETKASLLLQALYAISITLLMIRLHYRVGTPKNITREETTMEKFLYDYIYRMTPFFGRIDEETAHDIASAVLSFKFGLYEKTVTDISKALARLPSDYSGNALQKALQIVQDRAVALEESQVSDFSKAGFEPSDAPYLAVNLEPDQIEDQDSLNLDNALLLLYTVAYLQSPDDGQSLDEHQNFVIQILEDYRESLNLK